MAARHSIPQQLELGLLSMTPKQYLTLPVYMERHSHPDVYLFRKVWNDLPAGKREVVCKRLTNLSYYAWLVRLDKPVWYRPFDLTAASIAVMYLTAGYTPGRYRRLTKTSMHEAVDAMQEYLDGKEPTSICSELVQAAMVSGAGNLIYEGAARMRWEFTRKPQVCKLPVVSEYVAYLDAKGAVVEQRGMMRQLYAALESAKPFANVNNDYLPQVILWQ